MLTIFYCFFFLSLSLFLSLISSPPLNNINPNEFLLNPDGDVDADADGDANEFLLNTDESDLDADADEFPLNPDGDADGNANESDLKPRWRCR